MAAHLPWPPVLLLGLGWSSLRRTPSGSANSETVSRVQNRSFWRVPEHPLNLGLRVLGPGTNLGPVLKDNTHPDSRTLGPLTVKHLRNPHLGVARNRKMTL